MTTRAGTIKNQATHLNDTNYYSESLHLILYRRILKSQDYAKRVNFGHLVGAADYCFQ